MADVQYVFRSVGAQDVIRTFEKIGDAAERSGKKAEKAMGAAAGGGRRGGGPQLDAHVKAAKAEQRVQERSLKAQERALQKHNVRRIAEHRKTLLKEAQMEVRAEERKAKQVERIQSRTRQRRRAAVGKVGSALYSGAGMVAGAAALAGGMALRQNVALRDRAISIATQGGGDANDIEGKIRNAALKTTGASSDSLAGGLEAFVSKTGRLDIGKEFLDTMARISVATNSSAEEVGGAMADLFEKFDITSVEEMEDAMSTLAVQGKNGAFELKDAAKQFPKLAAAAQRLGIGKGKDAVGVLGGLTQIARRATGSPEQAASALEATFRQLTSKAPELRSKYKVGVFDEKGQARDVRAVLAETIANVGGTDIEAKKVGLQGIFGEEGIRAISPLISTFADATARGEDGMAALRKEMDDAIEATGARAEMDADLAMQQQKSSAQLTGAWEQVKASLTSLTPVVAEMAGKIAALPWDELGGKISSMIEVFGVAGDSLRNLAKWADDTFGTGDGGAQGMNDPAKKAADAQAKLDDLNTQRERLLTSMGVGPEGPSPEELQAMAGTREGRRLAALDADIASTTGVLNEAGGEAERRSRLDAKALTREQATMQFVSAAGDDPMRVANARANVDQILNDIQAGREVSRGVDTSEQQRVLDSFAQTVQANRTRTGGTQEGAVATDVVSKTGVAGLEALAAALKAKADEINSVRIQGPGSGPSALQDG